VRCRGASFLAVGGPPAHPITLAAGVNIERRNMADGWILKGIQDLVDKIKLIESEKREAVARVQELEREKGQAAATIEALERAEKQTADAIEAFEREEKQAAVTIQELEREKKQAAVTIQGLERQVGELGALIALASEKVAEALKETATDDISQLGAVSVPVESKGLGELVDPSPSQPEDLNQRFPRVFDPTEYSTR
jgi:seryl-tRNA synthetase